jgi:hypothetical protein
MRAEQPEEPQQQKAAMMQEHEQVRDEETVKMIEKNYKVEEFEIEYSK